jgi:hypothetical protein
MPVLYEFFPAVSVTSECTYEPHLDLSMSSSMVGESKADLSCNLGLALWPHLCSDIPTRVACLLQTCIFSIEYVATSLWKCDCGS